MKRQFYHQKCITMNTFSILLRSFNDLKTWGAHQCNQMYFHNDACIIKYIWYILGISSRQNFIEKIWFIINKEELFGRIVNYQPSFRERIKFDYIYVV